ncbi:MAG: 3-deoxy-manno-octulosonate cytidylyltransferase [Candidatus Kapaibacterium sp.]|jgi:3-deoxy-manno-octulosonate cytidylyltransferase (CMP-KDO synthetase)|nr:MAG: 3-deoxy-manno-octulosonate cytidylyltransferase [Candidatus Kapabacteria bacterium]
MRSIVAIPARYGSERFPGKVLCDLEGQTMLERVWRAATEAEGFDAVVVLTDDERVGRECQRLGCRWHMTPAALPSGTDRIAYAVERWYSDAEIIVNLQADEPLVPPALLSDLRGALERNEHADVATPITAIAHQEEVTSPTTCKVICRNDGTALYFSRAPIPADRKRGVGELGLYWKHIGIYAYRRRALERFAHLPPHPIECAESLEQLRLLLDGAVFLCVPTDAVLVAVDTPADAERVRAYLRARQAML